MKSTLLWTLLLIGFAVLLFGCIEQPPLQPAWEWLSYEPIQCQQNPWEKFGEANKAFCAGKPDGTQFDSLDGCNQCTCQNGNARCTEKACQKADEKKLIENYYKLLYGTQILDYKIIPMQPGQGVCTACNCARGDTIRVLVNGNDVLKMLELGWKRIVATEAIRLTTTKQYFISGETVQLKLQNDSDKPIYFFYGKNGKTIEACGAANAIISKMTNKFERVNHYKPIACMPTPSFEKLGPGQETILEWQYPQIFREDGTELPLLGEYKIAISYSEQENGSQPREVQSNEFLIAKGLFVQFAWKTGDLTETIIKLEDRVLLERAQGNALPETVSIPLLESEQKEWENAFIGSGLFTLKQQDLKPNNFAQNNPEKTLRMRYNDLQTDLEWNALEEEPTAIAYAINQLNETRKRFDQIIPTENEWLSYSPLQCDNNPWEQWEKGLKRQYVRAPTEQETVTEYLQTIQNVKIVDYRHLPPMPGTVVCAACNCPRGDSIQILVNKTDENKLQNAGWKKEFKSQRSAEACNWTPGPCDMVLTPGYTFDTTSGTCKYISRGSGCTNPPFKTELECLTACGAHNINLPNPASAMCIREGGTLDNNSNCVFGSTVCPEWDFYRGKCGQEFTSCAKAGHEVKSLEGYTPEFAYEYGVCITPDGNCTLQEFNVTCPVDANLHGCIAQKIADHAGYQPGSNVILVIFKDTVTTATERREILESYGLEIRYVQENSNSAAVAVPTGTEYYWMCKLEQDPKIKMTGSDAQGGGS